MEDYEDLTAIELVQDEQFIKWAKHPGLYPELDKFWRAWLVQFPHKLGELNEAREIIIALGEEGDEQSLLKEEEEVWSRLNNSIASGKTFPAKKVWMVRSAAMLLMLIAVSILLIARFDKQDEKNAELDSNAISITNNGIAPKTIVLGDRSSIILEPKSTLTYPKLFGKNSREVFLSGEAFFEITKEPERPFIVHAGKIVAKVLGTTFTVRAFKDENDILVQVKTGKVSVLISDDDKSSYDSSREGVLLIPNQQAVFSRDEKRISKSLIENPALLNPLVKRAFVFKDTPVKEIFSALQDAYGVIIVYDEELMRDCALNITLEDMPLYDKIRLICKTLEADYEILDSHIVVSGKGCK